MITIRDFVCTHYRSWLLIWLPFLLIWAWGVRYNPLTDGPGYGDALEVVWGFESYADFLRNGTNPLYNPLVFYPAGWHTATLAHTPALLLLMGLADLWLPAALVYNLTVFASSVVCYAGMRRLVSLYVTQRWIVILVALLYTFWDMRWLRLFGHLHTAWLSALLPWMVWFLLADLPARRRIWGAGMLWGCAIVASLYGIWLGALVVAIYVVTQFSMRALRDSIYVGLIALVVSSPVLILFWQANQSSDLFYHGIEHVVYWSASLNSLFVPFVLHPWWQKVAALFYPGPYDESGILNFGLMLSLATIVGLFAVQRRVPVHRFAVVAAGLGLILALGPILRWSGKPVQFSALILPDSYLWRVGQMLKPGAFPEPWPSVFAGAVPLPAYLFYAALPFAEGARVATRFGFVAALGVFPLSALALTRIRRRWLAIGIALLLLLETLPWPVSSSVPFPPEIHPAIAWLRAQPDEGKSIVLDLAVEGGQWTLPVSGEILYGTTQHGKPAVSGVGSLWPHSVWKWIAWLSERSSPLTDPVLSAMLAEFDVEWILVHVRSTDAIEEIEQINTPLLEKARCFEPSTTLSAWPYSICVLHVVE